jgi:hypothetical protein
MEVGRGTMVNDDGRPPAPTVRPENVPENARPALIRSVKRGNKEVWRWVWMWLIDGA